MQHSTSISHITNILPNLLDPNISILNSIQEYPKEADSPNFFRFVSQASNTEALGGYRNFFIGGAAAATREMALVKTIGETIERYCPAIYNKNELSLTSYVKAKFSCIHPNDFALYNQAQYNTPEFLLRPFKDTIPVRWVEMTDLYQHSSIYVPAVMVYLPYVFYKNGDEVPIAQCISTGLSCHASFEAAAIGGICEVIERDCFMITWQAQLSRPKITLKTLSKSNQDLVQRFEAVGYQVYLMDITNESRIPAILAVLRHDSDIIPIVVAASAALSPEEAVRKSLEEAAHTERYVYQVKTEFKRLEKCTTFDNIVRQVDHVNYWSEPSSACHAEFLYASQTSKKFHELQNFDTGNTKNDLQQLISNIHDTGYKVLVKDITTPDIQSLGLHVIRAVIPGYQPLFFGYHKRSLSGQRLWTIPQKLGFKGITETTGDNPFPHPFP